MNLFGTDGIRGVAGDDLSSELAFRLGKALCLNLPPVGAIAVGKDTRVSGDMLEAALTAGITSGGRDVMKFGVVTTPGLSYLVRELNLPGGIMVSASHNPFEYNGLKVFGPDGKKIPDSLEVLISRMVLKTDGPFILPSFTGKRIGRVINGEGLVDQYVEFLCSLPRERFSGLRVLLDAANGSVSGLCTKVWAALGARAESINASPNGYNINLECGATHPQGLSARAKDDHFDVGFAFDGDGDRLIAVDETGQILDGDYILAQMALDMKERDILPKGIVVGTVMANLGLEMFLKQNHMDLTRTPVGDRYVLEKMDAEGLNLGGEQSGHIIFRNVLPAGDGLITSILLTDAVLSSGKKFSEVAKLVQKIPQVMVNIQTPNPKEVIRNQFVQKTVSEVERYLGSFGRVLVRASGTEPLVRVMVESNDHQKVERCIEWIEEVVRKVV